MKVFHESLTIQFERGEFEMDNITFICPIECGNAPKKIVLRDLILAFVEKI